MSETQTIPPDVLDNIRPLLAAEWKKVVAFPPHQPHEYAMRRDFPLLHLGISQAIQRYGLEEEGDEAIRYVVVDGYKYWTFQMLVNRIRVDAQTGKE